WENDPVDVNVPDSARSMVPARQVTLRRPDGSRAIAAVHLARLRNSAGDYEGLVASFNDITAQQTAAEQVRQSEERLRILLAQMPAIVSTWDSDLRLTSVTGAGIDNLAVQPASFVGKSLAAIMSRDDPRLPPFAAAYKALRGESSSF